MGRCLFSMRRWLSFRVTRPGSGRIRGSWSRSGSCFGGCSLRSMSTCCWCFQTASSAAGGPGRSWLCSTSGRCCSFCPRCCSCQRGSSGQARPPRCRPTSTWVTAGRTWRSGTRFGGRGSWRSSSPSLLFSLRRLRRASPGARRRLLPLTVFVAIAYPFNFAYVTIHAYQDEPWDNWFYFCWWSFFGLSAAAAAFGLSRVRHARAWCLRSGRGAWSGRAWRGT